MKRSLAVFIFIAVGIVAGAGWYLLRPKPDSTVVYELHSAFVKNMNGSAKKIEYFYVEPSLGRPWPAVIFIHGFQEGPSTPGGREFYDAGEMQKLAERGILAVSVSQPGFGGSDGPPDFGGPLSQSAAESVIGEIRARDDVRYGKIVLLGIGRGAGVAAIAASGDTLLAGAVLISGVYNFKHMVRKWRASKDPRAKSLVARFQKEAGFAPQALRERSVLMRGKRIEIPILAIHGEKDALTDPPRKTIRKLKSRGLSSKLVLLKNQGNLIDRESRAAEVDAFLNQVLH